MYSFGMMLFEMTTRRRAFHDEEFTHQIIENIMAGGRPNFPESTPESLKVHSTPVEVV